MTGSWWERNDSTVIMAGLLGTGTLGAIAAGFGLGALQDGAPYYGVCFVITAACALAFMLQVAYVEIRDERASARAREELRL